MIKDLHIRRGSVGFKALCNTGNEVRLPWAALHRYYRGELSTLNPETGYQWCRDCKAALTPLDELGNTEL